MKQTDVLRGLDAALTLREPAGAELEARLLHLSVTSEAGRLLECSATWRVSGALYQHIDRAVLFELDPERRGPMQFASGFDSASDVEITTQLSPELLAQLACHEPTARACADALLALPADHVLLRTSSWGALSVSQECNGRRNGYRVYRSSLNLMKVLGTAQDMLGDMEQVTASMIEQAQEQIPVFAALYQYFTALDWDFALDESIPALLLRYRGEHGEWNCIAEADDDDAQFVFYSECPIGIPVEMQLELMAYLGRANSRLMIGNFEMNLDTGLVRFRTSVDVMGTQLNHALAHNAVRWNVAMMDRYLPGIEDVLAGRASAAQAIAAIEGQQAPTSTAHEEAIQP